MKVAKVRQWRPVEGCEAYLVSNDGRVKRASDGRLMKPSFNQGRPRYHLPYIGGNLTIDAHVLVAQAFLPPPPPGKTWVLHRDDDPLNCVDANLKWGDLWDNAEDRAANNRKRRGKPELLRGDLKTKPNYRLNPARVLAIRKAPGLHAAVAKAYGVSRSTVTHIKSGRRWPHLFAGGDGQVY